MIPEGASGGGGFDADAYLDSLVPVGWKLGLERMELLSDELGRPQDSFESIHVVGTNGKSSVTRMTAAIAGSHGHRTGVSISPHLHRWSERVMVDGEEIRPDAFAAAVAASAEAAERVNERLQEGDFVTQFEVATAAAFLALAEAGVELAVIEAGLGGRLDATNSIASRLTVLTSIGLDHTEYLGETELEIAAEKLAVLRPGTALVLGAVSPRVERLARDTASERGAELILPEPDLVVAETLDRFDSEFQRRNFTLAAAAAGAWLGELEPARVHEAAGLAIPGRLELVSGEPPTYLDVAHNRPGAAALAEGLAELAEDRPLIACMAILADKDAAGMLAELAAVVDRAVFTELPQELLEARGRPGAACVPAAELAALAADLGIGSEVVPDPVAAVARAREIAAGMGGSVIVAGSHYLLTAGEPG